ncbi:hypothetical protein HMPREF1024_04933 [Klebsiella sp. 4_1_44FAA]|nr:hypothetical protein HMPREF1024_04933 [Klebsiella sp. 4_1_44FAA]SAX54045.1 Uncharacterised protein [Klebsiella pneumoniae]
MYFLLCSSRIFISLLVCTYRIPLYIQYAKGFVMNRKKIFFLLPALFLAFQQSAQAAHADYENKDFPLSNCDSLTIKQKKTDCYVDYAVSHHFFTGGNSFMVLMVPAQLKMVLPKRIRQVRTKKKLLTVMLPPKYATNTLKKELLFIRKISKNLAILTQVIMRWFIYAL